VISPQLFALQDAAYRDRIAGERDLWDGMVITNRARKTMGRFLANPVAWEYSMGSDWDDRWRTGGTVDEVVDEAHLGPTHILEGIERFVRDREKRIGMLEAAVSSLK